VPVERELVGEESQPGDLSRRGVGGDEPGVQVEGGALQPGLRYGVAHSVQTDAVARRAQDVSLGRVTTGVEDALLELVAGALLGERRTDQEERQKENCPL